VLKKPEVATDLRFSNNVARVANRPALNVAIAEVFDHLTHSDAVRRLKNARIAFGSLNGVADLSTHPQLRRMKTDTPTGPVSGAAPPALWREMPFEAGPVPALDQHGDALRREFAA
jgi:itaconate CoA-transferase